MSIIVNQFGVFEAKDTEATMFLDSYYLSTWNDENNFVFRNQVIRETERLCRSFEVKTCTVELPDRVVAKINID